MRTIGFKSCEGDPDLFMREFDRFGSNETFYEYMLLYVDGVLSISDNAEANIRKLSNFFPMKESSIKPPSTYLGSTISQAILPNGVQCWTMGSSKYIKGVMMNVEKSLKDKFQLSLPKKATNPFPTNYSAEVDTSPELPPDQANYFQTLIGIAIWLVELGRIDIHAEVSMLSSHLALPRRGHMNIALHLFSYLKNKHYATLAFDPTYPSIDPSQFTISDWKTFYGNVKESLPVDAPQPHSKEMVIRCFVDAGHAGDLLTRRSRTGFFIYLNNAPIYWYSKKQTTIETSTFDSEFVAMKIATEYIRAL
jgi:hypothetical protein